ncbi:MAG: peptidoglycan-binding protein [Eggerthellaceae bacterium]|nr:peptidoglycan-binding protein [Eggerthellaceae bacterium]
MISNSGHDENGRYTGGKAGDQTGGEWELRSWYNRPWDFVARHPDAKVRKLIAQYATNAAKNDKIGYDQSQRTTFWQQLKNAKDYDPKNIKTACEADCSAGVAAIVKAVGYRLGIEKLKRVSEDMWTGNERSVLKQAGFEILTASKYLTSDSYLLAGDVLCNESHHTAINVTDGAKANSGGSSTSKGGSSTSKKSVDAIAREVIDGKWGVGVIRAARLTAAGYNYNEVQARVNAILGGSASTPSSSVKFPLASGHWFGVPSADDRNHSGYYSEVDRPAIKRIQQLVGVTADGFYGANTKAAVVKWQRAHGLTADGEVGINTWSAMFG